MKRGGGESQLLVSLGVEEQEVDFFLLNKY